MKNERLRTQTLLQISAYLDDALSPSEKQKLEARLKRDPKLREHLEKLRQTKIILGHMPRWRAPRSYILTPDMVRVRRPRRKPLMTTLRMATALSAVLLVVLVGMQLFMGGGFLPLSLSEQAPVMESARLEEETTPQPLIQWGTSGVGGAGVEGSTEGMGGGAEYVEAPVEEMESALPEDTEEESLPKLVTEELPEELPEMAPESDIAPPAEGEEEAPASLEQDAEEKNLILGVNPDEGGEIIDRSEPAETPVKEPLFHLNLINILMLGLAVIVIVGSLTLLLLRKRR